MHTSWEPLDSTMKIMKFGFRYITDDILRVKLKHLDMECLYIRVCQCMCVSVCVYVCMHTHMCVYEYIDMLNVY